jgi:hypothetical protein
MRHYHVQEIVATYENPVEMVAEVMGELSASDIFYAPARSITELEKTCAFISHLCKLSRFNKIEKKKSS